MILVMILLRVKHPERQGRPEHQVAQERLEIKLQGNHLDSHQDGLPGIQYRANHLPKPSQHTLMIWRRLRRTLLQQSFIIQLMMPNLNLTSKRSVPVLEPTHYVDASLNQTLLMRRRTIPSMLRLLSSSLYCA